MRPQFVPGIELARLFYAEVVRPLVDESFPGLPHSAALIGPGSEVLGFDTPRSADHDWGPRLQLLLPDRDVRIRPARRGPRPADREATRGVPGLPDALPRLG